MASLTVPMRAAAACSAASPVAKPRQSLVVRPAERHNRLQRRMTCHAIFGGPGTPCDCIVPSVHKKPVWIHISLPASVSSSQDGASLRTDIPDTQGPGRTRIRSPPCAQGRQRRSSQWAFSCVAASQTTLSRVSPYDALWESAMPLRHLSADKPTCRRTAAPCRGRLGTA